MPADSRAEMTAPAPRHPFGMYAVCLVCLGNICRSPMAAVVLCGELERAGLAGRVEVDSAGTGDWHLGSPMDARARAELGSRGYQGSGHRARQFLRPWFGRYDLVAAMDSGNYNDLRRLAPDAESARRVRLFRSFDPALDSRLGQGDVPDPYYGTAADYAQVLDLVLAASRGLADQLAVLLADRPAAAG